MSHKSRVALTSRVLCLAAVFGVALLSGRGDTIRTGGAVLVVGALAGYVFQLREDTGRFVLPAESLLVSVLVGLSMPGSAVLMPYLVVLAVITGLFAGSPTVVGSMVAQAVGLLAVPLAVHGLHDAGPRALESAPWVVTGLAGALLGMWVRNLAPDGIVGGADTHYESARALLTQLRLVARRLSAGLDSDGISAQLMETVHEHLEDRYTAVFVQTTSSVLIPLGFRGSGAAQVLGPADPIVARCWAQMTPVHGVVPSGNRDARHRTALPLRVGSRMIGVVFSSSATPTPVADTEPLMKKIDAHSLRLDTALVFDEIRTLATADERKRMAREIHDGIAQEVASLGYVVDDLSATTSDPAVVQGLRGLRDELSRVVADLRLSIFDLRSDVSPTNGLGAALSDYVRQVGAKSELTVHLTLDEGPTRLTPAVESELLRIAQEAVTNARKHSSAHNLWVDFWTDPPRARLVVRDDGTGINGRRDDSFGIPIMRERAERIDATLDIVTESDVRLSHGTAVQVTVSAKSDLLSKGASTP